MIKQIFSSKLAILIDASTRLVDMSVKYRDNLADFQNSDSSVQWRLLAVSQLSQLGRIHQKFDVNAALINSVTLSVFINTSLYS